MKVQIDLDPRDVWWIQETAERLGVTPGEVVRSQLRARRAQDLVDAIRDRVKAGMCDADIGGEFGMTLQAVAVQRRRLGLRANPHPRRGKRVGVPDPSSLEGEQS